MARWKPTYWSREEALDQFVRLCIKGVTNCSSKVNDPETGEDICSVASLQEFVNEAVVRLVAKVANSLRFDQATLEHDIRKERERQKRKEESSG